MKCTFALTLQVLLSILSFPVSLGGKVHVEKMAHVYTLRGAEQTKRFFRK